MYKFSKRSWDTLRGVKTALMAVAERALQISRVDFTIVEGYRRAERQNWLYKNVERGGKWLTDKDGYIKIGEHQKGNAIDFCPYIKGKLDWDNEAAFVEIGMAFMQAGRELGIPVTWGGKWKKADLPHVELKK